jgi:hypothetical protein
MDVCTLALNKVVLNYSNLTPTSPFTLETEEEFCGQYATFSIACQYPSDGTIDITYYSYGKVVLSTETITLSSSPSVYSVRKIVPCAYIKFLVTLPAPVTAGTFNLFILLNKK